MTSFFKAELIKEAREQGYNQQKVVKKFEHQTGKSNTPIDKRRSALVPGKRISRNGKTYWESRKNRSDLTGTRI